MSFPRSPRLLKGGVVLVDAASGAIQRIVALQYNPDSITRTLQAAGMGTESADRSEALRLKGPPMETIKLEAELDATDLLESGDEPDARRPGCIRSSRPWRRWSTRRPRS